jgi:hypothetical protein
LIVNPQKISELLHHNKPRRYQVKVGEGFRIELPKIPMTADTEFLQLVMENDGGDCVAEDRGSDPGEGSLQPREITGTGAKAGKMRYRIRAVDALSQQEIEGVAPLDIELEVME